nr:hypothetical protein [Paenibacillus bovis]
MDASEIKMMRVKQILVTNGILLITLPIIFSMIFFLEISMSTYFFILAFLVLIQAAAGVVRGYSTKSIIPIFEQVATYEKEKMGIEWKKQRKTSIASSFFVSIVMFLNAMMSLESTFEVDFSFIFILIITAIVFVLINIGLLIHIRKVDGSNSQQDMKGYTMKTNLIGIVIGIVSAIIILVISLLYVMS